MSQHDNPAAARFKGFCFDYDRYRPVPPTDLMELGKGWTGLENLNLVVDLGCGTGLSTRPWAKYSEMVIGIDPSPDMLSSARNSTKEENVSFQHGFGNATELEDGVADIVTCATAVHWMEPVSTVAEMARILKPKGVLLIYDHYYPMFQTSPKLTEFYEKWRHNTVKLEKALNAPKAQKWGTQDSLDIVKNSDLFIYSRKHYVHSKQEWSADDIRGFIMAHSVVHLLRSHGHSDSDLMLDRLEELLNNTTSTERYPLHLTYMAFLATRV